MAPDDDHGYMPDRSPLALLLIDVINDLEFPGAERLLAQARPMAERLAALKQRAKAAGVPVIYVNDNFGRWRADFKKQVHHLLEDGVLGEPIARRLLPEEDDYFVLKPLHSGFYQTTLETLLDYLGAEQLILTGISGDICVLFTANDAYMRGFELMVPADCVVSNEPQFNQQALDLMARVLKADTRPSTDLFPLEAEDVER